MQKILNIHFKDYFWGKFEDLHERYYLKKITISNIIELFTRLQESMSHFSKELNTLITKDYILFPEQRSSKYDALEFIKLILTIQSTQLNVGVEVIKSRILETLLTMKNRSRIKYNFHYMSLYGSQQNQIQFPLYEPGRIRLLSKQNSIFSNQTINFFMYELFSENEIHKCFRIYRCPIQFFVFACNLFAFYRK